jgi:hypothetical protein
LLAVVGLLGGTFVVAAIGGGVLLAYRMLLGHEDRVTAAYVPRDAWAYVALNTDPTSQAWRDAWEMARRVGLDDELSALPEQGLEDSGEDPDTWDQYIRPAIGREVGFAVWPDPRGSLNQAPEPRGAVIVMVSDQQHAREAIELLLEDEAPATQYYRDVRYQVNGAGDAVGIVDEALVAAESAGAFEDVVDARLDGALDSVEGFTAAADRATADPLVFVYADSSAVADALEQSDQLASTVPLMQMGSPLGAYDAGIVTMTIHADGDALRIVTLTEDRPANFPTTPAGDGFATEVPAATLLYVGGTDLYTTIWEPMQEQLAGFGTGGMPAPGVALEDDFGMDAAADLPEHLTGDWAMSLNGEEDRGSPFGFAGGLHFFSEVDDETPVLDALHEIADALEDDAEAPLVDRTASGFTFAQLGADVTAEVSDGVLRVHVNLGSADDDGTLAGDESYRRAMDGMPDDAVMTGYVALRRALDLIPADAMTGMDPEARGALETLGALAWSSAPDGAGTRTDLVLYLDE